MNPHTSVSQTLFSAPSRPAAPSGPQPAPADGTAAPASTEFSRMLAHNKESARLAAARQNNALAQGKFTVAPKTPGVPAQPVAKPAADHPQAQHQPARPEHEAQSAQGANAAAAESQARRSDRAAQPRSRSDAGEADDSASTDSLASESAEATDPLQTKLPGEGSAPTAAAAPALPVPMSSPLSQAASAAERGSSEIPANLLSATAASTDAAATAANDAGDVTDAKTTTTSLSAAKDEPARPKSEMTSVDTPARADTALDPALAGLLRGASGETKVRPTIGSDAPQSAGFALPSAGASSVTSASQPPAAAAAAANVPTPLTDPGFKQALGYQVSLLARDGVGQAELHLNPADMGPVSVQITMNGDQARVDFGADLAQTRQVIEAGWAELAASLKEAGFTLSGGGVSDQASQRQASQGQEPGRTAPWMDRQQQGEPDAPAATPVVTRRVTGGVDVYA